MSASISPRRWGAVSEALALAAVFAWTNPATAGPCLTCTGPFGPVATGYWHDRALSPAGVEAATPRIDVDPGSGPTRLAVTWAERAGGDGDIVLALSDDGGCSWQQARLTSGLDDDSAPDVAVSSRLRAVVVTFMRNGHPWATASADAGATFLSPEDIGGAAPVDTTSVPRIAGIALNGAFHVHVAWTAASRLYHARSLVAGARGSFAPPTALSDAAAGWSAWSGAEVAADTRSSDAFAWSGVTVVASGVAPGSSVAEVFSLRSNDAGATFFGDPTDPASRSVPHRVSDPRADDASRGATEPVIDGSDDGEGAFYVWNAVLWTDARFGAPLATLDARAEEGATPSVISDWNDPPVAGDAAAAAAASRSGAIALVPNPLNRPPKPDVHVYFTDETTPGAREVGAMRAMLDEAAVPSIVPVCAPFQLSGLFPPRIAGEVVAGSVSADEDLSDAFVVWADTRDGAARIELKRTDTLTAPPTGVTATAVSCTLGGGIEITWKAPAAPPHCDVDHYRVDYGPMPGAPDTSVDVASTTRAVLTGLSPGVRYHAVVTTVDEACNEASGAEVSAVAPDCTGATRCPNPVGGSLRVTRPAPADVRLAWQPPPVDGTHDDATSYDVYRADVRPQDGYAAPVNATAIELTDADMVGPATPEHLYYLIIARNACGTSGDEPPR